MILHCVYLQLSEGYDHIELASVMSGLSDLCDDLSGCQGLKHGANVDLENKSPSFPYGFVATFDTTKALAAYALHPTHKALGARLCALCDGGAAGIIVYDLEVGG